VNAVFFETDSDSTTQSVHSARRKVLRSNAAYPEYQLFAGNAHYSDMQSTYARAGTLNLISAMGHGAPDEFTGQWGTTLYDMTNSKNTNYTFRNAIVHLFSCDCAQSLGPFLINSGAKAFIGYLNPVTVPNTQSVVDEFVKVAAEIDRSILLGDSSAITKRKADAEFVRIDAGLRAGGSAATTRDLASFRLNHNSMVGPWSNAQYGSY